MTEQVISKETLQEELDGIKSDMPKRQWRYYYIESIQNFIYHLDNFPSERTQERIAVKIKDYLDMLRIRTSEEHDLHDLAKQLLPDVWKLSREYVDFQGFIKKPSYPFRIVLGIILYLILQNFLNNWIAFGIVAVLAVATIIHSEIKIRASKYW